MKTLFRAVVIAAALPALVPALGARNAWATDSADVAVAPTTEKREPKHHEENATLYRKWGIDPRRPLYSKTTDARRDYEAARERARAQGKFLMVTFGANWCPDCRALHRSLENSGTRGYVAKTFEILNVDVGDFDRNTQLAADLGVDLDMGIPVAVFFGPEGQVIGNTNHGELEPARSYTSRQILAFLREIAERRHVQPLKAGAHPRAAG